MKRVGYNRDGFEGNVLIFEALSPTFSFFLLSLTSITYCIAFSFYYTGLVVYQCGLLNVSVLKQEVISRSRMHILSNPAGGWLILVVPVYPLHPTVNEQFCVSSPVE